VSAERIDMQPSNEDVAERLDRIADLLEAQEAEVHRVRAYRKAAGSLRSLQRPIGEIDAAGGRRALEALPAVGKSIAALLHELLRTGRMRLLERLEGEVSPEDLFTTLPGIGEKLAARLHEELGLETLEDLELAAHDGRLEELPGFGPKRARLVRDVAGAQLLRSTRWRARRIAAAASSERVPVPSLETLLAVDAEYRRRAAEGSLRRITPRRFNPERRAWLPILHVQRDGWSLHALFSNTARAHQLGRTHDWVVVYWERDGHEGQCTVVTEGRGGLAGRRVLRGREEECSRHYAAAEAVA